MDPYRLTRAELVDFARNAATAVASGRVDGLLPEQIAIIAGALGGAADELADSDLTQVETTAAAHEATQIAQDKHSTVLAVLFALKFGMKSVGSSSASYNAVGFDTPAARSIIMPQAPTGLAASGFSNGVNILKFSGNNVPGTVTYIVEARLGPAEPYTIVGTSTKQSFKHFGVVPGQYYRYRVRAQASRGMVSDWSNEGVIYGSE